MNNVRFGHACSGYYNQKDHFVLLVVGGNNGKNGGLREFYLVLFRLKWSDLYGAV